MRTVFLASIAAVTFGAAPVAAIPLVTHATDPSVSIPDVPVSSFDTFEMLEGAFVSFGGAGAIWTALAPGCGGAEVAGFSLTGCGDTFGGHWSLLNGSGTFLPYIVVDLTPIGHWFDRTDPSPGTPGSAAGLDFGYVTSSLPGIGGGIHVTYSVAGASPPEDLWGVMRVDFEPLLYDGGCCAIPTGHDLTFVQDTDSVGQVPIPAAGWLLLGSLAGLVARRNRRSA